MDHDTHLANKFDTHLRSRLLVIDLFDNLDLTVASERGTQHTHTHTHKAYVSISNRVTHAHIHVYDSVIVLVCVVCS